MPSSRIPHSAFRNPHSARPAFTLVEMLVVIAIIGLLAAILMPAVYSAVIRARRAAVANDISQLEMAVEKYKNDIGDYPPNFYEAYSAIPTAPNASFPGMSPAAAWSSTTLARHLKRINRNAAAYTSGDAAHPLNVPDPLDNNNPLLKTPTASPSAGQTYIDAAETLVFWLGGLSSAAAYPITGPGGPMNPVSTNHPYFLHPTERDARRFEFDETRLRDIDQDGFFEYYPPYPGGGAAPYVYFDSRSYDETFANFQRLDVQGRARPYLYQGTTSITYANPNKFQIITAGLDDHFGAYQNEITSPPADRKLFPTGAANTGPDASPYTRDDFDNMTNFSEGGTLEDRMP